MTSPFQQANSRPSEHQRRFDRMTMTFPSWTRPSRRPVCRSRSSAACCMILCTRLRLTAGSPFRVSSRFTSAVRRKAIRSGGCPDTRVGVRRSAPFCCDCHDGDVGWPPVP